MPFVLRMSEPSAKITTGSISCDKIDVGFVFEKQGSVFVPRSRPRFVFTEDHGLSPPLPESVTGASASQFSALAYSGEIFSGTCIAMRVFLNSSPSHVGIYVVSSDDHEDVELSYSTSSAIFMIGGQIKRNGNFDVFVFGDPALGVSGAFPLFGLP